MKTFRLILIVVLALAAAVAKYNGASSGNSTPAFNSPAVDSQADGSVPAKVYHVLQIVRSTGQAPEGYVGGRVFQNREGRLPADGDYREFDVDPHHGGRNAERLIVEWNTKKAWYTDDHYRTFIPLP